MKKNGFTLVELLAVIAILAILVIIAMPNVLDMFNKAKQDAFETEVKTHMKVVKNHFITTGSQVFSNVVVGAEELPMDGEELYYYIVVDSQGNIKELNVTNGEYKIEATGTSSSPVKAEQIGDTIKSEVAESGKEFSMDSNGNIIGESSQNSSQIVKNLNINWKIRDAFDLGKTIISYDSSKQTAEQFFDSALGFAWDYDVNYYKISNTPAGTDTQYYVETSINGTEIKDILYRQKTKLYNTEFDMYNLVLNGEPVLPYLINAEVDKSYIYQSSSLVVNLSKGLWFFDFLGNTIESSEYFIIKEAIYKGKNKNINGTDCLKISNITIGKEDLIGKELSISIKGNTGSNNDNKTITEDLITQSGSVIIVDDSLMIVPNDGIYIPTSLLNGLYEVTIKTQ